MKYIFNSTRLSQAKNRNLGERFIYSISIWRVATILSTIIFFGLSVHWSYIDNSPPAWDQGLYLFQATILHNSLVQNGLVDFLISIFNTDRGRVPLMTVIVQPAFYLFGPSLDAAVISQNFAWFILAWSLPGIAREVAPSSVGDKAGFFAFILFGFYPLTVMLSHNYLVELLLVAFVCASIYSLILLMKTKEIKWSLLAGVFVGFGLLTKITYIIFIFPVLGVLVVQGFRESNIKAVSYLFLPALLLSIAFAGPYYFFNFKQIFELTVFLSSKNLSKLYGFGGAFNFRAILEYWHGLFVNPVILVAAIVIIATLFFLKNRFKKIEYDEKRLINKELIVVMGVWFIVPFLLATFGEIKDPRYIYPGLVPIFVFAGVAVAQNSVNRSGAILMALIFLIALPGYLYSNNFMSKKSAGVFVSALGMDLNLASDAAPDHRDWQVDKLVRGISQKLDTLEENKKVVFLGGNRYYHLRLLDYEGLINRIQLSYIVLPYYSDSSMSLEDALEFIKKTAPAGIIYKSGENWPAFSSRLDSEIVARLKVDPGYAFTDLDIEQPDGSRFTLFFKRSPSYMFVRSGSALVGSWRVEGGLANIVASDAETLAITTETGLVGYAVIRDGSIYAPEWKVSGKITSDVKSIYWSNGSIWHKFSANNPAN